MEADTGVMPMLSGGHEPRNANSFPKLEEVRNGFSPTAPLPTPCF